MKKKENEINKLCKRCSRECKQNADLKLIACPKFELKPKQLEFKFKLKATSKLGL